MTRTSASRSRARSTVPRSGSGRRCSTSPPARRDPLAFASCPAAASAGARPRSARRRPMRPARRARRWWGALGSGRSSPPSRASPRSTVAAVAVVRRAGRGSEPPDGGGRRWSRCAGGGGRRRDRRRHRYRGHGRSRCGPGTRAGGVRAAARRRARCPARRRPGRPRSAAVAAAPAGDCTTPDGGPGWALRGRVLADGISSVSARPAGFTADFATATITDAGGFFTICPLELGDYLVTALVGGLLPPRPARPPRRRERRSR